MATSSVLSEVDKVPITIYVLVATFEDFVHGFIGTNTYIYIVKTKNVG